MKIRLLNSSIYGGQSSSAYDPSEHQENYPVVVEAEMREESYLKAHNLPRVSYSEMDRVFPIVFSWGEPYSRENAMGHNEGLTWWPGKDESKSWEPVTPFDYWNKLKSSRPVGEVVPKGYL